MTPSERRSLILTGGNVLLLVFNSFMAGVWMGMGYGVVFSGIAILFGLAGIASCTKMWLAVFEIRALERNPPTIHYRITSMEITGGSGLG